MVHITVQYDENDRTFKLVDDEFGTLLEGDALCDAAIPLIFGELAGADNVDSTSDSGIAHA